MLGGQRYPGCWSQSETQGVCFPGKNQVIQNRAAAPQHPHHPHLPPAMAELRRRETAARDPQTPSLPPGSLLSRTHLPVPRGTEVFLPREATQEAEAWPVTPFWWRNVPGERVLLDLVLTGRKFLHPPAELSTLFPARLPLRHRKRSYPSYKR